MYIDIDAARASNEALSLSLYLHVYLSLYVDIYENSLLLVYVHISLSRHHLTVVARYELVTSLVLQYSR